MTAPVKLLKESKKSLVMMREFRLDATWYKEKYPDSALALQSGQFQSCQEHFESIGYKKLYSPSPYFCSSYYARQSKFWERKPGWGLVEDYLRYGALNMMSPHWLFNEAYFLEAYPEVRKVKEAGNLISGYQYYIRRVGLDQKLGRPTPLFNKNYYIQQCGRELIRDPFFDFIAYGNSQGLLCSPLFDPNWYSSRYPEIKAAVGPFAPFASYFQHYMEYGLQEGKIPIPDFDSDFYLKEYPDLEQGLAGSIHPVQHFLFHGIREGRRPNRFFDTNYYLEHNPEAVKDLESGDFLGPFEHFLAVGVKKNFKASAPLINLAINEDVAKALYEKRCRIQSALVKMGRNINIPQTDSPVISAIIPVVNHFDFTINLLSQFELFAKASHANLLEIIVVDNGSSDSTLELTRYVSGIKVLRFDKPMGYPGACNAGAREARGRLLLFLNNDIEILPGSLERVVEIFDNLPEIGATGGRIIKLNGDLQEAGGIVWNDGSTWGYGRGENPLLPRFQFQRDVDYCSGCFLAVEAAIFRQLDGFGEQFAPGYYEETDLCARLWKAGRRVVYDPGIGIFHYEFASYSKGRPETIATGLMAINREKFVRNNREFIAARPRVSVEKADIAANRTRKSIPRVLIIEDLVPRREMGSGFCRSEDIVREFLQAGWWVTIWVIHKRQGIEAIDAPFCETLYADEQKGGLGAFLLKSPKSIDLIWLCRTHNLGGYAEPVMRWRAENPDSKVVCDTEAIASVRYWLMRELGQDIEPTLANIENLIPVSQLERELKGHTVADLFVAVSELDARLINLVTPASVKLLGHKMPLRPTEACFEERKDLLFCGAIHEEGAPNYDSLIWFSKRVLPLLKTRLPGIKLNVVGYWRSTVPIPPMLYDNSIELFGQIDDLTPYFAKARVFVAPTRVAAGIPHKVHESMGFGLPTVVTPILANQLGEFTSGQAPAFFAAHDFSPRAFADAVVALYTDIQAWEKVRSSALAALSVRCSADEFTNNFKQILNTVLG